jgi:predicted amidohydrolase YtcJ
LRFSTHLDAPVVPVDSTLRLWAPVSRNTHGGDTLGPEQTVDVMQSIRAMTIDAAWQMHLDADVGSIEVGKYADLVVLDKNPLTVPSNELRSIQIMQTVVGGVPIYSRP